MSTAPVLAPAIEAALIHGDLSKLDPAGRLQYYKAVCESVGLNPLTRPFEYITLNNKLQLYAKKDCTDQLRSIHNISVIKIEKERIEDVYAVTAYVRNNKNREDSSIGAVTIGNAKGDALANMLMKAETKAKRRATLSICGLGILDETEIETIPNAAPFTDQKVTEMKPLVTRQLEASLEQKPPVTPENVVDAKVLEEFHVAGDRATCVIVSVDAAKNKKGKDYLSVIINGDIEESGMKFSNAFVWDTKLFAAIHDAKDKVGTYTWKVANGFLQFTDVIAIGDEPYEQGRPVNGDDAA